MLNDDIDPEGLATLTLTVERMRALMLLVTGYEQVLAREAASIVPLMLAGKISKRDAEEFARNAETNMAIAHSIGHGVMHALFDAGDATVREAAGESGGFVCDDVCEHERVRVAVTA